MDAGACADKAARIYTMTTTGRSGSFVRTRVGSEQHQFNATGNVQLLEDAKHVILDGVFAEVKLLCDLTVAMAASNEIDDLFFAPRH
jgi:hypothetical protein